MRLTVVHYLKLVVFLNAFFLQAQESPKVRTLSEEIPFTVYRTFDKTESVDEVIAKLDEFVKAENNASEGKQNEVFWVRLDFRDHLEKLQEESQWYLRTKPYDFASLFYTDQGSIAESKFGYLDGPRKKNSLIYVQGVPFESDGLIEGRYLYVRIQKSVFFSDWGGWTFRYASAHQHSAIVDYYSLKDVWRMIPHYLFIGMCAIMLFLTMAIFIRSRRKEFLYYGLYVASCFACFEYGYLDSYNLVFGGNGFWYAWYYQVTQVCINLFYLLFVIHYLETKKNYPFLHKIMMVVVSFLVGVIVFQTLAMQAGWFDWHAYVSDFQRYAMVAFGFFGMLYLLRYRKEKISLFVVIGSFCYMAGALLWMIFWNVDYALIGTSLEILIFSLGLSYKIKLEYDDRIRFEKESIDNAGKALRAQMNPHFVFNSLNSIQYLVINNDKEGANKYLVKFSRLMRSILESSFDEQTTLSQEIEAIQTYLSLEALRFNETFKYSVTHNDALNIHDWEIPHMIIQPFIENAIVHGLLLKKDEDKMLSVHFEEKDGVLLCIISDNGVGGASEKKDNGHDLVGKRSRGIQLVKDRLALTYPTFDPEHFITVVDRKNTLDEQEGTVVTIKIPKQ